MRINNTGSEEFNTYSENIFRTLIEESPLPVGLYVGREMVISVVNDTILKIWGKDESVIGKTYREALPELEGQPFFKLLDDVYTTGIPYHAKEDVCYLMVNGELRRYYFNFAFKPLKTAEGKIWGILNTGTDVTDLVLMRKQLEEAETRTNFALDAAGMGTWDLDLINNSVTCDNRCKELFGFPKDGLVRYEDLLSHMHPDDIARVDIAVMNAINPQVKENYDVTYRTVGYKLRWVRCKGRAYFDDNNKAYRFAGTVIDITPEINTRDEQQKLLFLIENSSDFISLSTWDGKLTYLNTAGRQMMGFNNMEDALQDAHHYLMPTEVDKINQVILPAMLKNGRWSGELLYRHAVTGQPIPGHVNTLLIKDPLTEEPLGRATVVRDLRNEIALKKEQQNLITVVENSADMIVVTDLEGNVTYINKAGQQLIGADNIEECYKKALGYFMPDATHLLGKEVRPNMLKNGAWAGEIQCRHFKTGEAIPAWLNAFTVNDPATGEPIGFASVTRDMRAEKAAQQALAQSEELFRKITIASPAALWMTDINSQITYVNEVWINWTGYSLAEQLGAGWLKAVVEEDRTTAANKLTSDFERHKFHESQFRIKSTDGQLRYIICTGNPQYNTHGAFTGYIGACVDITELKQLQRQKDDFIGIASHELKTPVTSIKAYTQLLESMMRKKGDLKEAGMISKMNVQINRLTMLIEDLLDVTKITSGRLQFHQTWFNFNQMMQEVVEDLQRTTAKHTLIEDFNADTEIYSDKDRVGQVLINLITNAIKYSPDSDEIIIRTAIENNEVQVSVQDFGIGIAQDKIDKVFEQFYRVSGDKEHTFPGLGLGLYISSEIIKREGGKIWVDSVEGKGSKFCFSLPIKARV
ncbi:PAS domain-containing sensor histidine kinase [Mucilaginibacter paludis]|uniref:histidine kinase n=1 Tax=Mucilaginibacter paludis DSM 18603 TaxID=714943 RepID=H1Y3Q5_9SPHI|nr:PAS domain S-box protein [Mucilaginibacter paludis]EHQ30317.1 PAS/PAC sensor signal transduction histidine kinase [Mucilaginibacter paludis DSM 18603]